MPKVDWQGRHQTGLFLAIAASVVVVDQITKWWIRANLLPCVSLPEEGFLRLTHVQNTGTAFGLLANQSFLLTVIAVTGLLAILFFYRHLLRETTLSLVALSLVFGGAVGNLIDRLRLGYVTDFIDIRLWGDFHWPAFNFADSSITVGAIILACSLLWLIRKGG